MKKQAYVDHLSITEGHQKLIEREPTLSDKEIEHLKHLIATGDDSALVKQLGTYNINADTIHRIGDNISYGMSQEDVESMFESVLQRILDTKQSHSGEKESPFSNIAIRTFQQLNVFLRAEGRYSLTGLTHRFTHEGDLALVCEATDDILGRKVVIKALKLLCDQSATGSCEVQFQQFKSSVEDACKLADESNFMAIYDAYFCEDYDTHLKEESVPYFVIQLIEGDSVRSHRTEQLVLKPREVRELILTIISAVIRIHKKDIFHGNIKPSNIMLRETPTDSIKLKNPLNRYEPFLNPLHRYIATGEERLRQIDNRLLALEKLEDEKEREVKITYIMEDLAYLPPELFGSDNFIDPQMVDQYMIGLLAYELLTNKLPCQLTKFAEKTFKQNPKTAFAQLKADLVNMDIDAFTVQTELRSVKDCPESFRRAILKMISRDYRDRYESLKQAGNVIERKYEYIHAKESLARCLKREDAFVDTFYNNLQYLMEAQLPSSVEKDTAENAPPSRFDAFFAPLKASPDKWKRHRRVITEAILVLLAFHDQEEFSDIDKSYRETPQRLLSENNILSRIAEKHVHMKGGAFRINSDDLRSFRRALITTICEGSYQDTQVLACDNLCRVDPDDMTRSEERKTAIKSAWNEVLQDGFHYMGTYLEAYRSAHKR